MKKRRLLVPLAFLLCSVLICCLTVGLFMLSGGQIEQPAAPPESEQPQPESPKEPRFTVILDAGHGGEDGGAVGVGGLVEKDLNLEIAKLLAAELEKQGVQVIMTRTEDVLLYDRNVDFKGRKKVLDLAARQAIGDKYPEALFVSIHANSFAQQQYHGLQIWYGTNHPGSAALAECIRGEVVRTLQPDNHRQSKQAGSNIYLLYHLKNPTVLIECGFLSNPSECSALGDAAYRQELARALCRGILAYDENDANDGRME